MVSISVWRKPQAGQMIPPSQWNKREDRVAKRCAELVTYGVGAVPRDESNVVVEIGHMCKHIRIRCSDNELQWMRENHGDAPIFTGGES